MHALPRPVEPTLFNGRYISVRNSVGVGDSSVFPPWSIVLLLVIEHHLPEKMITSRFSDYSILLFMFLHSESIGLYYACGRKSRCEL